MLNLLLYLAHVFSQFISAVVRIITGRGGWFWKFTNILIKRKSPSMRLDNKWLLYNGKPCDHFQNHASRSPRINDVQQIVTVIVKFMNN